MSENVLRKKGYLLLVNPEVRVQPLELLLKGKGFIERQYSAMEELFRPNNIAPPVASDDVSAGDLIEGTTDLDLGASLNFSWANAILKCFGAKGAQASAALNMKRTARFSFQDAKANHIGLVALTKYLKDSNFDYDNDTFTDHLKNSDLYVITSILKTNSFSIEWLSESSVQTHGEIGDEKTLGIKQDFNFNKDTTDKLVYDKPEPITFAVKAHRILFERQGLFNKKTIFKLEPADDQEVVRSDESFHGEILETGDDVVMF
ncbi:MAG TPA: hypothetical protein VE978_10965 [Chitinophagales bacterium]|nr:hypothetical protein [Chitinophagales bacterium]